MVRKNKIVEDGKNSEVNKLPTEITSSLPAELEVNKAEMSEIKLAAKKVGIGLESYLSAIKEALAAEKSIIDKFGERYLEPDHDKRLKAALMGLEVEGYIKAKGGTTDNSKHTHVTYAWLTNNTKPVGPVRDV
jgi:hypothetical protein